MRKISTGEPLPYNNIDQIGNQICDSYPLLDASGNVMYIHTFDYAPFNVFNQHSGSDGYDVYVTSKGALSISSTKDGGGYGSTFFGEGCEVGNGWALFPTSNITESSEGYWPISGRYWERDGQNWPGECPTGYSTNTLTLWEMVSDYTFGGINGNNEKSIDTLISYHGYETDDGITPTQNFLDNGHLEVFYFTQLYGLTRWEVWVPTESSSGNPSPDCNGPGTGSFKSQSFVIENCHDWSNIVLLSEPVLPEWPVVNANLLKHFHFDSGLLDADKGPGYWYRFGLSTDGNLINWSIMTSSDGPDTNMKYLAMNCGAAEGAHCGEAGTQAIYQDIPISKSFIEQQQSFLYGANVRTAAGSGSFSIVLQVLNNEGSVLWQDMVTESVVEDNGDGRGNESESVYLSCKFIFRQTSVTTISDEESVSRLRYLLIPNDENTFFVADTFVNLFPKFR
eukprot:CAMPEP_0185033064 /NCGR_PEP_ID=MMETSP1103-20130426/21690_1 /TAXON_ID=36769 /ORGANISM="Paraphysomonas bandaiensis, Strain Caron Lab Isolate" /LENGTH=450 /DNA_ID=CAMNT_0027569201 /DNA_START=315 /DNA_END=1667 /DNA_ORIENTATION=-